jgi:tRNA threonylcarbamoyl adenosine modification protein YeaZ
MWYLALDTSGPILHVALSDGTVTHSYVSETPHSHSEELAHAVSHLLERSEIDQLAHVVVGAGPGSFTGLRIGFGFAKGFAFAHRIPLTTACTFKACAREWRGEARLVVVLSDARRGECFYGIYHSDNGLLEEVSPPAIASFAQIQNEVSRIAESRSVSGDEILYVDHASGVGFPEEVRSRAPQRFASHLIDVLLDVGRGDHSTGSSPGELAALDASYVRAVSALTIAERLGKSGSKPCGEGKLP